MNYGRITPTHQVVYEGQEVVMQCNSQSQTYWLKDGKPWPPKRNKNYKRYKRNLLVVAANKEDSGLYICEGSYKNREGENQSFDASAWLHVGGI